MLEVAIGPKFTVSVPPRPIVANAVVRCFVLDRLSIPQISLVDFSFPFATFSFSALSFGFPHFRFPTCRRPFPHVVRAGFADRVAANVVQ